LDGGLLQKASGLLDLAQERCQKNSARETEAEILLVRARYYLMMGEFAKAKQAIEAANSFIDAYGLNRLKPTVGVYLGELLVGVGKPDDAIRVWEETAAMAKKFQQRNQRAKALLGLIQLQRNIKTPMQLSLMLYHVEKDVRAIGSKKLKAKFLVVKGIICAAGNSFDHRFFSHALRIMETSSLVVMERQVLEVLSHVYKNARRLKEEAECQLRMAQVMENASVDLHLVGSRQNVFETCPVSLTV
jgi:tetratricopeptide (TPR) repeat protein